jgi:hypothetical protein
MGIKSSLTSASIMFLIVTIGQYLEGKIKRKIERITRQIFTESSIFSNMKASYVEATVRLTSLEERCGQDGSLAVAARCDNHQRQRGGSVERHEAARPSAKSFPRTSSKK